MLLVEVIEEIRIKLREPQVATTGTAFLYDDYDLCLQLRSAIRNVRAKGIDPNVTISLDTLTMVGDLSDDHGMLLALYVVASLLEGDLTKKLQDGEFGIYWKEESSVIDTKQAATVFAATAKTHRVAFEALLTGLLSDGTNAANSVFGGPELSV